MYRSGRGGKEMSEMGRSGGRIDDGRNELESGVRKGLKIIEV